MADPVGAIGIQADLATFSALSCHGLGVTTALLISDTARVEDQQEIDPDWVSDQARVLLEDMTVAAIKIGAIGNIEQVTAIAEIVSDYPDVPLVLDPFVSALPEQGLDGEDILTAVRQLLVPQTTLLMLSQAELERLAETWREPHSGDTLQADIDYLLELGCEYVLLTGTADTRGDGSQRANTLYGAGGVLRHDPWLHLPGSFSGAGGTLSAAITAMMALADDTVSSDIDNNAGDDDTSDGADGDDGSAAHALLLGDAVQAAQDYTAGALAHAQRFGMGRLVPDRFFNLRPATRGGLLN